jgi:YD repeat-containing protein
MKRLYTVLTIFCSYTILAQNPEIRTDMPSIMGPSPTVAALMKFEEAAVSNYTGTPDISIPLFSTATHSKDIMLNIALKYNPTGIAAEERASCVGLGWALFAGGTISRTVRGLPDELKDESNDPKLGLYRELTGYPNNFDQIMSDLNFITPAGNERVNKYLWDSQQLGIHDGEYDLWQFNFMGQSGRFYIKKNHLTGALEVKGLDDYRLKIINSYDSLDYKPQGFTIFDDKGYRYVFDIAEITTSNSVTYSLNRNVIWPFTPTNGSSITPSMTYASAFHLTHVYDNNNKLLIELQYSENDSKEITIDESSTENFEVVPPNDPTISIAAFAQNMCQGAIQNLNPLPFNLQVQNQRKTIVRNLSRINVIDIAKIDFDFQKGRADSNLHRPDSSYVFKGVTIKTWNDSIIKKYRLDHSYSTVRDQRMILTKVSKVDAGDVEEYSYQLNYQSNNAGDATIGKDYWGFFNLKPPGNTDGFYRKTSPSFCTSDVLQKMTLPTGGCVLYDYEANTYSYIGNQPLANFDDNDDNWASTDDTFTFDSSGDIEILNFSATENQRVRFHPSLTHSNAANGISFHVKKDGVTQPGAIVCPDTVGNCFIEYTLDANSQYSIVYSNMDLNDITTRYLTVTYFSKVIPQRQYLYGGGIRIRHIGFFDDGSVDQKYFQEYGNYTQFTPAKVKRYDYYDTNQPARSSGSLAFGVPKFEYTKIKKECPWCDGDGGFYTIVTPPEFTYRVFTSFNNLQSLRTQGSDVGYKNVIVSEEGNGKTQYTYTSPIDFPEDVTELNLSPPFLPTINFDYKRGLLKSENIYNNAGSILKESLFEYSFVNSIDSTGVKTYYVGSQFTPGRLSRKYYNQYRDYISTCEFVGSAPPATDNSGACFCWFGDPMDFTAIKYVKEAFGWAKLTSKTTKEHFYEDNTQRIIQTDETFAYNATNKQIAEHTTNGSNNEILKTEYFYHSGNSDLSQNRISEIQQIKSYNNGTLISNSKIVYDNTNGANHPWLPKFIQSAKGSQPLENKVKITDYDEFGNPEIMSQAAGNQVYYIWGYNETQPVAKIETSVALTMPSTLVASIKSYSNSGDEVALTGALQTLRDGFPNAMVTTYTYYPLIGIRTITDPKGSTTYYDYDEFGRLKLVRDNENKIVSENQYHYKTQN